MLVELVVDERGISVSPEQPIPESVEDLLEVVAKALVFQGCEVKIKRCQR